MKKLITMLSCCLALGASASTMLLETFEPVDGISAGPIDGQNGWVVSNGTAAVQTGVVQTGSQALEIDQATVMHDVSSTNSAVWIRFQARISGAPTSIPSVDNLSTSAAFFVNTNLHLVAYSNDVPVDLGVSMPVDSWKRFDVYCDYDLMVWNLSMDGTTIGAGLPLHSTNTTIGSVRLSSSSPAYVDQLDVADHELAAGAPDTDLDNIPDWWELKYFGGITAATAASPSANNGMTYLETYIAGVQPFAYDPFVFTHAEPGNLNWIPQPDRLYDIQWTPSLSSNFTTIATVEWPIGEFTDTPDPEEPTGFYRLKARLP
ncbi:MAG: hypothetical protein K9M45_03425 [Kiritimatiellales bacterium]|nr:hypothetical protein [Kiritimatiellales bacterium]